MSSWSYNAPTLPAGVSWGQSASGDEYSNQNNLRFKVYVSSARGEGSTYYIRFQARFRTAKSSSVYNPPSSCTANCGGDTHSISVPSGVSSDGTYVTIYYTGEGGSTDSSLSISCSGTCSSPYARSETTVSIPPIISYPVTFNGNGSDGGSTAAQTKVLGVDLTLAANGFTRTGYNFLRWNTAADGSGTDYAAGGTYSGNAALTLYAIWEAAASQILSVNSSVQTLGSINLQMDRKNPAFWHKATYSLGGTTLLTSAAFETALTTAVPRIWFANTPDSATISVTLSVQTYTDSSCTETMGLPVTTTITVTADDGMKPEVTAGWATLAPYNAGGVSGFTGYIKGYSCAEATFDAAKITHATGASLGSYSVTYKSETASVSPYRTGILTDTAATVIVKVTDTRGRSASETMTLAVGDYNVPTITNVTIAHCQNDGTLDEGGYYLKVKAKLDCIGLGGQNTVSATVAVAPKGGSYGTPTALASNTALVIGTYNPDASWQVKITATDTVGNTVTYEETIPQQTWAMKFRPNGTGVGFGRAPSADHVFEIDDNWAVKGQGFIDLIYPVGSIYISTVSTSPATLFGGTWVQIEDTFLLAAGSTYTAGDTGGEATHTLTVNEMPSHSHIVSNYMSVVGWSGRSPSYSYLNNNDDGYVGSNDPLSKDTGGGQAHNNMPPYLVVYVWKRTA